MSRSAFLLSLCLSLSCAALPAVAQRHYRILNFQGDLPKFNATALNNKGQVVGYIYGDQSYFWEDGQFTKLETQETGGSKYYNAQAKAINDKGQVIGIADAYDANQKALRSMAVLWQNGIITGIPGLPRISSINNVGDIAGGNTIYNFKTGHLSRIEKFGNLALDSVEVSGVNDAGQASFSASLYDSAKQIKYGYHLFSWQGDTIIDLGHLPDGLDDQGLPGYVDAQGINQKGQIVGCVQRFNSQGRAAGHAGFLWNKGHLFNLGSLNPVPTVDDWVAATAINNIGEVVGNAQPYFNGGTSNFYTGFLWRNDGPGQSAVALVYCGYSL